MLTTRRDRQKQIVSRPSRRTCRTTLSFALYRLVLLAAAAWVSGGLASPSFALDDSKQGVLGHLARHIGTSDFDAVLDDPHVGQRLAKMLGPRLGELRQNLGVRGDIDFVSGWLVLQGGRPGEAHHHSAIVVVRPNDGVVHAAIFEMEFIWLYADEDYFDRYGKAILYDKNKGYESLPSAILRWIKAMLQKGPIRNERPSRSNFEWVR